MAKAQKAREPGAKPSIFLSHSSADAAWCRPFFEALQQKGFDIWYHEDQQSESAAQRQTANEQVRTRDVFLVVLSPDSYNAPHVQDEILLALASQRFILSVIIGDIPTLGLLTAEMHIDVRGQTLNDAAMTTDIYIEGHEGSWWYRGPQHAGAVNPMRVPARVPEAFSSLWEPGEARLKTLGFVPTNLRGYRVILPPMRDIPAGPFLMGSNDPVIYPEGEGYESIPSEAPQFTIATPAFQIATYPLTVAEYACAVQAGALGFYDSRQQWITLLNRLDHPHASLNWTLATRYAAWLSKLTGQHWYLPSEVEWEKAARGTDGRRYPWGSEWDPDRANIGEKSRKGTAPIGSYPSGASPYGCQDMAGNVWEVTRSRQASYPYDASDGREEQFDNPLKVQAERIVRGGSWEETAEYGQTAIRYVNDDAYNPLAVGVRLARRLPAE